MYKAFLILNLDNPTEKVIVLANDPGTAVAKAKFHHAEIERSMDARDYLMQEALWQHMWLGTSIRQVNKRKENS